MSEAAQFRYDMRPRIEAGAKRICEAMVDDLKSADLAYDAAYIGLRDAVAARDHEATGMILKDQAIPAMEALQLNRNRDWTSWQLDAAREVEKEWHSRDDAETLPLRALALLTT